MAVMEMPLIEKLEMKHLKNSVMSISNPAAPVKIITKPFCNWGIIFVFGFVTWINSILIPYFKLTCNLSTKQSMLVAFAFYISYFVMALPAAAILKRTGLKNGMMLGLFVMAVGALVLYQLRSTGHMRFFLLVFLSRPQD